jgi:transcriptional regulator with XRE-family HTH domain
VQFNLFTLRRKLEIAKGHEMTWEEIATQADLHPNTLYNLAANRSKRVDLNTIEKLLDYFNREGVVTSVADLFAVAEVETALTSEGVQ